MRVGILRETKDPPDRRVAITPAVAKNLLADFSNLEILVQPSPRRCFRNKEYKEAGLTLQEDLSSCDFLIGVKEVKIDTLLPNFQLYNISLPVLPFIKVLWLVSFMIAFHFLVTLVNLALWSRHDIISDLGFKE